MSVVLFIIHLLISFHSINIGWEPTMCQALPQELEVKQG